MGRSRTTSVPLRRSKRLQDVREKKMKELKKEEKKEVKKTKVKKTKRAKKRTERREQGWLARKKALERSECPATGQPPTMSRLVFQAIVLQLEYPQVLRASKVCRRWRDEIDAMRPSLGCDQMADGVLQLLFRQRGCTTIRWNYKWPPTNLRRYEDVWSYIKWTSPVRLAWWGHSLSSVRLVDELPRSWFRSVRMLHCQPGDYHTCPHVARHEFAGDAEYVEVAERLVDLTPPLFSLTFIADGASPRIDFAYALGRLSTEPGKRSLSLRCNPTSGMAFTDGILETIIDVSKRGAGLDTFQFTMHCISVPMFTRLIKEAKFDELVTMKIAYADDVDLAAMRRCVRMMDMGFLEGADAWRFAYKGATYRICMLDHTACQTIPRIHVRYHID